MEPKYIVAIEIGSSKIKGAVGTVDDNGEIKVLALEEEKKIDAVRYGCIMNVAEVSDVVQSIVRKLENYSFISPNSIKAVYVGLGGRSLSAVQREVQRQLPDEIEISERIIEQTREEARNTPLADRDIVDVTARQYLVNKRVEANPVGVFGSEISAHFNLLTCRPQIRRNLNIVLCERLQLGINGCIVRPTAIADLVLTENEKRLGVMLVDFGAETTTVSIYKSNSLQYLVTIPLGSRNITRDITSLNCLEERAEELKKSIGCVNNQDSSKIDGVDQIEISNFVQARAGEIVANIVAQIEYAGYKTTDIPSGIVVVGGGAKLRGFNSMLESQSGMKVRSGAIIGHICFSDGNLQGYDSIDVVAILAAAARRDAVDCLDRLEVEEPAPVETVQTSEAEPSKTIEPVKVETVKPKSGSRWAKLKNGLLSALAGPDDDDTDDDEEDDDIR